MCPSFTIQKFPEETETQITEQAEKQEIAERKKQTEQITGLPGANYLQRTEQQPGGQKL